MRIVSHVHGSVLRLISIDEILPLGCNMMLMFAQEIARKFNFKVAEQSSVAANAGMLSPSFQAGSFNIDGADFPITTLDFQGGRIAAACTKTDQTLEFLTRLFRFLEEQFGFRKPNREVVDFVSSAIVVDYGPEFASKIQILELMRNALNDAVTASGMDAKLFLEGVKFSGAVTLEWQKLSISYNLEARAGRPPGTNWLFSHAPLSTSSHEELLTRLEEIAERL